MNPLLLKQNKENFKFGKDNLSFFQNNLLKQINGAILFCQSGEAKISIDLREYHICTNTSVMLLPESIFSLIKASSDFYVKYFLYSKKKLNTAFFLLEPNFFQYLKVYPCYNHRGSDSIEPVPGLITACEIYTMQSNQFKENILQNLLQIFFLDAHNRANQLLSDQGGKRGSRKGLLFNEFINLIHKHLKTNRQVAFYADLLCISTRYLSTIANQIGQNTAKSIIDELLIIDIKSMLSSTGMSIKEITEEYNFPDQSFFTRYFKKHTNATPIEYKRDSWKYS